MNFVLVTPLRVENFVLVTPLRSLYSLAEAFLHAVPYSAQALSYIKLLTRSASAVEKNFAQRYNKKKRYANKSAKKWEKSI